jgi:acyl-CoA dehydrogenase
LNAPNEVRSMLVESATRLLKDHVDRKLLEAARDRGWSPELWQKLDEAEFPRVSLPEESGGAGGALSDLAAVLRVAGRFAAPVPLAETAMLAGWMLAASGLMVPRGPLAAGPVHGETVTARREGARWILNGRLARVPWARTAFRLVLLAQSATEAIVANVDPGRCQIEPGRNLAGEPRDAVVLENVPAEQAVLAGPGVTRDALRLRGALARSLLMAGALERALELSVEHAQQRVQFGRKIGQFQAIQHEIARLGGEAAAAVAATLSAAGAMERGGDVTLAVASAKIRTAEAARDGTLIAHQVHGAIGVTDEHALHHSTLRLWAWREEYGNEAEWEAMLGGAILQGGADQFWPAITAQ